MLARLCASCLYNGAERIDHKLGVLTDLLLLLPDLFLLFLQADLLTTKK